MKLNWLSKNQKKIYITGGILLLLLILYPYFLSMPELMFGLLGGVLVGIISNKIINNTVERRSMKLNVQKEERRNESGSSTGNEGVGDTREPREPRDTRTARTRITIPSVESRIQGDSEIDGGNSETKIQGEYAERGRVQDTANKQSNNTELFNRESSRKSERTNRETEFGSGEDSKASISSKFTIPSVQSDEEI